MIIGSCLKTDFRWNDEKINGFLSKFDDEVRQNPALRKRVTNLGSAEDTAQVVSDVIQVVAEALLELEKEIEQDPTKF
jgi:hypothetical protein